VARWFRWSLSVADSFVVSVPHAPYRFEIEVAARPLVDERRKVL